MLFLAYFVFNCSFHFKQCTPCQNNKKRAKEIKKIKIIRWLEQSHATQKHHICEIEGRFPQSCTRAIQYVFTPNVGGINERRRAYSDNVLARTMSVVPTLSKLCILVSKTLHFFLCNVRFSPKEELMYLLLAVYW